MNRSSLLGVATILASVLLLAACSTSGGVSDAVTLPAPAGARVIPLGSSDFTDGGRIPARYTCDGRGISPLLQWSSPGPVAEYVLFLTDPDASGGTFVHWVMFGIPPNTQDVGEGQGPSGARQGVNGFGSLGYGPPCPPGTGQPHHYVFTLYGLSTVRTSGLESGATAQDVLRRISCCIEAMGTLTGVYKR